MAAPIFISYSSTDLQTATKIRDLLLAHGHQCFMAPDDLLGGDHWSDELAAAIDRASMIVLIFSERCNRSDHIKSELTMARTRGLPIIPYRIEDVLPRNGMEYFTSITHWLNDFRPPAPPGSDLLLKAVRRFAEPDAGAQPRRATLRPAGGDRSRLLERLGEEMLEQRQPIVAVDGWSTDEQADLWSLIEENRLRNVPSPAHPDKRFVGFVRDDECLSVLAAAVKRQALQRPEVWLQRTEQFPLLADALGLWLAGDKETSLPAAFARQSHAAVPRVMRGCLTRIDDEPARLAALKKLLPSSTPDAIRGFIQATQDIAGPSAGLEPAAALLEAIGQQVDRGARADSDAGAENTRLKVEVANQFGRVCRRQGKLGPSFVFLQTAVELAKSLKDERLLGVCTTNLCRAQLDAAKHGQPIDRAAIIRTLEKNVARLERCGDKRNLAVAWNNLGDALAGIPHASLEQMQRAEHCLRKDVQFAEEFAEQWNDIESLVDALDRLGVHLSGQEQHREAIEVHSRERELFSRLFDFEREAQCLANLGRAYLGLAIREPDGAEVPLQQAIQILSDSRHRYGNLNRPPPLGAVLENLGKCHWITGDTSLAVATLYESVREYERWPQHVADAQRLQGDLSRAGF